MEKFYLMIYIEIINGKYINGEIKENKQEFNAQGKLIYDGEYVNGLRNGKGREYCYEYKINEEDYITTYYEGNFIDGVKIGNFSKYYKFKGNFILVLECEFFNDKENGKGKEYDYNGILIFEGEYANDKKNGKYKIYDLDDKLIFEGEYVFGHRFKGKEYINGKLEFEGDYQYDKKWNGKGYDENGNVIYELINGNEKVKEYYDYRNLLLEKYINGLRNEKGKEYDNNGNLIFEGEYLNGKKKWKRKRI